jgi:ParB family transcriptional regulator, chromosome partitioning protein
MRLPWKKPTPVQLDLLGAAAADAPDSAPAPRNSHQPLIAAVESTPPSIPSKAPDATAGQTMLPLGLLFEDPRNPRTEFPEAELTELADDIQQHGILQPIVVHPADADGRHQIHFGAKRFRAAMRAGLVEVPVVIRAAAADPYTQVAENQKRHGLTPLDLARFIKGQVDTGESNTSIAKRLGMNLTTVAHHLALLDLPPALDEALKSGRCTSPRTLHELSKLHEAHPDQVGALIAGDQVITRAVVSALHTSPSRPEPSKLLVQASAALDRLEQSLTRVKSSRQLMDEADIAMLQQRLVDFTSRWSQGV